MKDSDLQHEVVSFPRVIEQPVMWGYGDDLHKAKRHKAIVDPDNGRLFSIVSLDYRLIRHEAAIREVEKAINKVPEFGSYKVSTRLSNGGGRMRRTYVFPGVSAKIEGNDYINPELHLFNSYDTAWPFMVILGAFRVVCENGLVVGKKFLCVRRRHLFPLDSIALEKEVSTALNRFKSQTRQWKKWTDKTLSLETYEKIMKSMEFGKKATKVINERMVEESKKRDSGGFPILSMWVFYNILTWYITYKAVSLNHRVMMERRLRKTMALFGGR